MRRRQDSPWYVAEKMRVRTAPTPGIAYRIADGENPFLAWRVENATTPRKLARLTGIDSNRLIAFEMSRAFPNPEELEALAKALRITPELLMQRPPEAADGELT